MTKSFALYSRCLFRAYTAFWWDPTLQDSPELVLELSPPFYKLQHDGGCGKTGEFYGRGPTITLLLLGCEFLHQKQCCVNIMAVHKKSSLISLPPGSWLMSLSSGAILGTQSRSLRLAVRALSHGRGQICLSKWISMWLGPGQPPSLPPWKLSS